MKIAKIKVTNFKCYGGTFEMTFNDGVNIIVGSNESGKSTILEAIHLALTGVLHGRYLRSDLSPYLFNLKTEQDFLASLSTPTPQPPPEIVIELYFSGTGSALAELEGNDNTDNVKASGISYRIEFDTAYNDEYAALVKGNGVKSIPIEYYRTVCASFARQAVTVKSIPLKSALVDSSNARTQSGSDIYISRIIREILDDREKASISQAHRQMRDGFMQKNSVKSINKKLNTAAKITDKQVSISVDLSSQSAWESSLMTYVDQIPFHHIGKGEQCTIKTKLALSNKKTAEATVLLIEEPENHLSHSKLNHLLADITSDHGNKQVVITTHSSFVANKLGLENLLLLRNATVARIDELEAAAFFKKLAGYDNLRLILSTKSILVEGDSDELIVQRAYMDANDGRLPIENNIDVISVGTSFLRFLELAKRLSIPVAVVTDTDGDVSALKTKYVDYEGVAPFAICYDPTIDKGNLRIGGSPYNYNTLEPKLLKANSRDILNRIFGTEYTSDDDLRKYMLNNKTTCALAMFSSTESVVFPDYINTAIKL